MSGKLRKRRKLCSDFLCAPSLFCSSALSFCFYFILNDLNASGFCFCASSIRCVTEQYVNDRRERTFSLALVVLQRTSVRLLFIGSLSA